MPHQLDVSWGRLIAVAVLAGLGLWWKALGGPVVDPRALWPILAVAPPLVNWFLTAFNAFAGREPTTSRYQYAGAIFVLLILACLLRDIRPSRNWLIVGAVLVPRSRSARTSSSSTKPAKN